MADRVRWGVLGNATIARKCVIPAIQKSRNGRVKALGTRSPDQAESLVNEYGLSRVYDNYDDVIADPSIDAVYIPLPNHLHLPWTLRAIRGGKHVLCEKPLACNGREAAEMSQAAREAGQYLMEGFMYRFHPRSIRIKEIIRNGGIGTLRMVRSAFCFHMEEEVLKKGENIRLKAEMGGGALLDVGCYGVSVARWLMDDEPTEVQALADYNPQGVDISFIGVMRFTEGRLATVEVGFNTALQQTYAAVGNNGVIELPHDAFIPWEKDAVFILRGKAEETGKAHITAGADQYQRMVEHFADTVIHRKDLIYSSDESVKNMQVLDALAEAARTGKLVHI